MGLGAAFECGALLVARWTSCGVLLAEDALHVTLDLPTPLRVRITTPAGCAISCSSAQLRPKPDPGALLNLDFHPPAQLQPFTLALALTCVLTLTPTPQPTRTLAPTPAFARIRLQLAPAADRATLPPIGVPSSVTLGVAVDYTDTGSGALATRNFSTDARVTLLLVGGGGECVQLTGGGVLAVRANASAGAGCPASVRVAAYVVLGRAGTLVSALFEVRLVRFTGLSLSYVAHPAGPSSVSRLRRIRCTQAFESARPVVVARLSSNVEFEVTLYMHCN